MSEITKIKDTIGNSQLERALAPIGNSPIGSISTRTVDLLLDDCSDLIDSRFKGWFAKRFYNMSPEKVRQLASEARQEGRNPQALFCSKVKRAA